MTIWHKLRLAPPTVEELTAAEPLLKELDPALVANGLELLEGASHEMVPLLVLLHLLERRKLGPVPTCRLLVRACLKLSGHPVRPLSFVQAFRPGRATPPTSYRLADILAPADGEAAA